MHRELLPMFAHMIPKPQQTNETLLRIFDERIEPMNDNIRERLLTYFGYIRNDRPEDWFEWALKGIATTATKVTRDQRGIAYLLGIYKNWLDKGFGQWDSQQFQQLKDLFTQRFGIEPSPQAAQKLRWMITEYGLVHASAAVCMTQEPEINLDKSAIIAAACNDFAKQLKKPDGGERQGA